MRPWHSKLLIVVGLVLLTIITYGRAGQLGFVNYDDPDYVTQNMVVQRGLNWDGVKWAFASLKATNWHPVTWLSHMLDCSLFGQNPTGHHWMNVILHGINAALLFLLLASMTQSLWPSAVAAALFAVHPLRVESVAWVAERKDVLSTLFGLLAVMAYVRWARSRPGSSSRGRMVAYASLLVFFGLSLMSKPMLVTLPFILLLLDFWPLQRLGRPGWSPLELVLEKLPLLIMSATSSAITMSAQRGAMSNFEAISLPLRFANAAVVYVTYLWQMIWPSPLAVLYPFRTDLGALLVIGCLVVLALITAAAWMFRRTRPYLLVGWLWYLGTLVPVVGLVQVGQQAHADRYTYVPMIGIVVALVWAAASFLHSTKTCSVRLATAGALAAIILAFCLRTHDQLRYWRDSVGLFEHSIAVAGGTAAACNNLGSALVEQGRLDEGIVWLERALQLNDKHAPAHSNLGMAYAHADRKELAELSFIAALQFDPDNVKAHYNLGVLRLKENKLPEAETHFRAALASNPDSHDAQVNLGNVLVMSGRVEEGQAILQRAASRNSQGVAAKLALAQSQFDQNRLVDAARLFGEVATVDPDNTHALRGLGSAALRLGRPADSIVHLRAALKIDSDHAATHNTLGLALAQTGQFNDAETAFREAVRLQPNYPEAWSNLGKALHALRQSDQAIGAFDTAIKQNPESASAHFHRGNVLLSVNRLAEARASYEQAVAIDQAYVDARYNLGFTLLRMRQWADAEAAFRETHERNPDHRGVQRGLIEAIVSQPDSPPDKLSEALRLAVALNEPSDRREPATMLMLAAAQSRNDRMADALASLNLAKALTTASSPLITEIDRCAALYNMGQPYAPPPASP